MVKASSAVFRQLKAGCVPWDAFCLYNMIETIRSLFTGEVRKPPARGIPEGTRTCSRTN